VPIIRIYDDGMNLVAECWVDAPPKEVKCYGDYWYQIDEVPPKRKVMLGILADCLDLLSHNDKIQKETITSWDG
jgi:hypothetical protein